MIFWLLSKFAGSPRARQRMWMYQYTDNGTTVVDHTIVVLIGLVRSRQQWAKRGSGVAGVTKAVEQCVGAAWAGVPEAMACSGRVQNLLAASSTYPL